MCKCAQAAPKIRPTGDTTSDQEMNFMRSDLQWIIDRLMREPGHIGAVKGYLNSRLDKSARATDASTTFKDATPLGKVATDEPFVLTRLISSSGLRAQDLDKARGYDPDSLKNLFFWGVGAQPGLVLPQECANKQIMALVLNRRAKEVGDRLRKVAFGAGMSSDGAIDWKAVGPYAMTMEGGKLTKVVSRPSQDETTVPANINITADYVLGNAHSETKARFVYGLVKIFVHELFASGTGPHTLAMKMLSGKSAVFNKIVTEEVTAHAEREREASKGIVRIDPDLGDFGSARKKGEERESSREGQGRLDPGGRSVLRAPLVMRSTYRSGARPHRAITIRSRSPRTPWILSAGGRPQRRNCWCGGPACALQAPGDR